MYHGDWGADNWEVKHKMWPVGGAGGLKQHWEASVQAVQRANGEAMLMLLVAVGFLFSFSCFTFSSSCKYLAAVRLQILPEKTVF